MKVFISDSKWNPASGPSEEFRRELEKEYGQGFSVTSIGSGAAETAWFTEIATNPLVQQSVNVFFAGGAIGSAAAGWLWLYSRIERFFRHGPVVDREAAAVLLYKAIVDRMGGLPKAYQLKGFAIEHRLRYADPSNPPKPDPPEIIEKAPERVERAMIYVFHVAADGCEFVASVDGSKVKFLEERGLS